MQPFFLPTQVELSFQKRKNKDQYLIYTNMKIYSISNLLNKLKSNNDTEKILLGRLLVEQNRKKDSVSLSDYEFQVFSQWGEDGIIQYLVHKLNINTKVFVEFGVETYHEANTRFLLMKDNWSGLVIDGSKSNIDMIRKQSISWKHSLSSVQKFITAENINTIITGSGIEGEIGILSVDIDGNDYWVTKAIDCIQPIILINEYNSVFGPDRPISVPYDPSFQRTSAHHSNLYYGASLAALTHLANEKGYALVGCNSAGNNAFFVRRDKLSSLIELSVQEAFVDAKFREARDKNGKLLYLTGPQRYEYIKGLPVVNVLTNQMDVL